MHIQITGHQIELTDALKNYVHKKSEKLVHHFSNVLTLSVVLSVERGQHTAEATITHNSFEGHASATAKDMYQAIDSLLDKLEKQLAKHKEKSS